METSPVGKNDGSISEFSQSDRMNVKGPTEASPLTHKHFQEQSQVGPVVNDRTTDHKMQGNSSNLGETNPERQAVKKNEQLEHGMAVHIVNRHDREGSMDGEVGTRHAPENQGPSEFSDRGVQHGGQSDIREENVKYVSRRQTPAYDSESLQSNQGMHSGFQESQPVSPVKGSNYGSPVQPTQPATRHDKPSALRMSELDRHVMSTPSQLLTYSVFELVQYLAKAARTEAEIAYVIYRWVTCLGVKDEETEVEGKEAAAVEAETAMPTVGTFVEHLDKGKLKHADLFSVLCKCTNLETHKVSGRVRHYSPQPSPQLCRSHQASWSAILLKEGWGLVDCCMGARHWEAELHRDGNLKRPYSVSSPRLKAYHEFAPHNFYFLPQPQHLVTSHLPDNPCWQLLPHHVAEMDFFSSLLQKPYFNFMGIELIYPTSLKVKDIAEEAEITWRLKGDDLRKFAFRLFCVSDFGLSHKDFTRYGFLETLHSRGQARLRLIPPTSGRYVCELYGAHVPTHQNEMTHMCSFDMDFAKTTSSALKFPENERVEWGPGAECLWLGMRSLTHEAGYFQVVKGQAEVVFSCSRSVLVTQKLFIAEEEGQGTEVLHSTVNFRDVHGQVRILLRIPHSGDYILSVFGKDEGAPGKCQLVCNYLVLCDSGLPSQIHRFPPISYNKLGSTKAFSDFHMSVICPRKSCIVVAPFSGKVLFAFSSQDSAELSCELQLTGREGGELSDMTDYVQHTCQDEETVFRARLPKAGDYLFHLYGKPPTGEGHKFLLYSALIECSVPCKDCLPLTKVVPEWRARVQILAPLRKFLVLGAVTHFAVRANRVKAVKVQGRGGTHKFSLESDEEEDKEPTHAGPRNIDSSSPDDKEEKSALENGTDVPDRNAEEGKKEADEAKETPVQKQDQEERATEAAAEGDARWQVWRCDVTALSEDEGSGMKLCVQDAISGESSACVAEFEVITERKMAAKLEQQQSTWAEAEQRLQQRPDSGHRSDLDDEETQLAYFLDDEIYASNPLGDDNSGDSDDDDSDDEEEEDARENFYTESDLEVEDEKSSGKEEKSKHPQKSNTKKDPKSTADHAWKPGTNTSSRSKTNATSQSTQAKQKKNREDNARIAMINKVYCTNSKTPRKGANKLAFQRQKTSVQKGTSTKERTPAHDTDEGKRKLQFHQAADEKDSEKENHANEKEDNEGTKERSLRRRLWKACQKRDREAIQKAVSRYKRGGYSPCPDLSAAERMLHMFGLRDALVKAIDSKDLEAVREALTEVERNGYSGEISLVCRKAQALLSPHRTSHRLPVLVEADMRTLLEIRSYRCPPEVVHHVIVAMLLLMGVHEGLTKNWSRCRRRLHVLGPQGVYRKMARVKAEDVHPEIASRARHLLDKHSQDEAHNAGPGVLAVYKWSQSVVARVEQLAELEEEYGTNDPVQPASKRRQRQIFKEQANHCVADSQVPSGNICSRPPEHQKREITNEQKQDKDQCMTANDVSRDRSKERSKSHVAQNKRPQKGVADSKEHDAKRNQRTNAKYIGKTKTQKEHTTALSSSENPQKQMVAVPQRFNDENKRTEDQASNKHYTVNEHRKSGTPEDSEQNQRLSEDQDNPHIKSSEDQDTPDMKPSEDQDTPGIKLREDQDTPDVKSREDQDTPDIKSGEKTRSKEVQLATENRTIEDRKIPAHTTVQDNRHLRDEPEGLRQPLLEAATTGTKTTQHGNDMHGNKTAGPTESRFDRVRPVNGDERPHSSAQTGQETACPAESPDPQDVQQKLPGSGAQKSPASRRPAKGKKEVARSRLSAATRRPKSTSKPVFHSTFYFSSLANGASENDKRNWAADKTDSSHTDPRGQPYNSDDKAATASNKRPGHDEYNGRNTNETSSSGI